MNRHLAAILLALAFSLQLHAASPLARPPEPWPGPKGEFVFAEAENFTITDKAWSVLETPNDFYGNVASGMKAVVCSGKGGEVLKHGLTVSQAGESRLWVRYSQSREKLAKQRGPFRVSIEQEGQVKAERVFDENEATMRPVHAGRGDPFVWDSLDATLAAGSATISFTAIGRPADARVRMIDCVLLTSLFYELDLRDFAPQTYVRIRLNRATPNACIFITSWITCDPLNCNTHLSASGWHDGVAAQNKTILRRAAPAVDEYLATALHRLQRHIPFPGHGRVSQTRCKRERLCYRLRNGAGGVVHRQDPPPRRAGRRDASARARRFDTEPRAQSRFVASPAPRSSRNWNRRVSAGFQ